VAPLSAAEQADVAAAIQNGLRFLLLSDNPDFAGTAEAANASILGTVGMSPGGVTFPNTQIATTFDLPDNPILHGRSGDVASFFMIYPGTWSTLGAATVLANVQGTPALAMFDVGDLGPRSARGVVVSDVSALDLNANTVLTNNIVDFLVPTVEELTVPEPGTVCLVVGALATAAARRKRRSKPA
jgi:hypothetical protein